MSKTIDTTNYIWINQNGRSACNIPNHAGGYLVAAIEAGDFRTAPDYGTDVLEIVTPLDHWIGFPPDFRDEFDEPMTCESCN